MIISATINALIGRRMWMKIKRKYDVESNAVYVVMMPDTNRDFNKIALQHIDDFLYYRKGKGVVILTTDDWTLNSAHKFSKRIIAVELITQREHYYFVRYYYFDYYKFSENFIMMSLQGNFGERLYLAENVNGINKADMACLGLYIIRDWSSTGASNG